MTLVLVLMRVIKDQALLDLQASNCSPTLPLEDHSEMISFDMRLKETSLGPQAATTNPSLAKSVESRP